MVRERMITALQDKKRRLDEEKGSTDIVAELASDHGSRLAPLRNLRRRGAGVEPVEPKLAKKKIVSGAHRSCYLLASIRSHARQARTLCRCSRRARSWRICSSSRAYVLICPQQRLDAYFKRGCRRIRPLPRVARLLVRARFAPLVTVLILCPHAVIKDAREKEDDVVFEGGAVLYQGNRYERGNHILIENKTESGRFAATITGISSSEVRTNSKDGPRYSSSLFRTHSAECTADRRLQDQAPSSAPATGQVHHPPQILIVRLVCGATLAVSRILFMRPFPFSPVRFVHCCFLPASMRQAALPPLAAQHRCRSAATFADMLRSQYSSRDHRMRGGIGPRPPRMGTVLLFFFTEHTTLRCSSSLSLLSAACSHH